MEVISMSLCLGIPKEEECIYGFTEYTISNHEIMGKKCVDIKMQSIKTY